MVAPREDLLYGRWVHSHEEDGEEDGVDEMVFRHADRAFPPARGRTSFELRPDGTYLDTSPGPTDRPEESSGQWSLDGDRLVLEADGDRAGHAWVVIAAEGDRLAVRE